MKKLTVAFAVVVLGLYIGGCDSGPKLVPAEGTVTLKGAPLANANVTAFYPDGNSATAVSDAQGKFALSYMGRMGAVPGTNLKVSVVKRTSEYAGEATAAPTGPPKNEEEAKKYMQDAIDRMKKNMEANEKKKSVTPKDEIDPKYGKADTSGLQVTIPDGGAKELKLAIP